MSTDHSLEEEEAADSELQRALLRFPGVLLQLLDKCGIQADAEVQSSAHFNEAR